MYVYIYIHIYVYMAKIARTFRYVCMHVSAHIYTKMHVIAHAQSHIHSYIHTCIRTYIHTYIQLGNEMQQRRALLVLHAVVKELSAKVHAYVCVMHASCMRVYACVCMYV